MKVGLDLEISSKVFLRYNRDCTIYETKPKTPCFIIHPDFQDKNPALFCDECHLSYIGNDIFLNTFQGAFETFIRHPEIKIYPVE